MKNLIKKILKESDFDWVEGIDDDRAMRTINWDEKTFEYFIGKKITYDEYGEEKEEEEWGELSDSERNELRDLLFYYYSHNGFNDVSYENGKVILSVDEWKELSVLFKDTYSDYGYIGRGLAETIMGEDDYWEPYSDTWYDFGNDVWDLVDDKSFEDILKWVGKNMSGTEIEMEDGGYTEINNELINWFWKNKGEFGKLVEPRDGPFEELRDILSNAQHSAYNEVSQSQYWNACHNAVTDLLGEGKWVTEEHKLSTRPDAQTRTVHKLNFDITNIFWDVVSAHFTEYCDLKYYRECSFEYSDFVRQLGMILYETDFGEPLHPRADDYPDHKEVEKTFNERLRDEI